MLLAASPFEACAQSDCLRVLDQSNRTHLSRGWAQRPIIDILGTFLALHGDKQWWPLITEPLN